MEGHYFLPHLMIVFNDTQYTYIHNVCSVYSNRIQSQTNYSHRRQIISFLHKEKIFMTFRDSYITEIVCFLQSTRPR